MWILESLQSERVKNQLSLEPWSAEEDQLLIGLVEKLGNQKWSDVARNMPGREGKQCRERWHNHLSPTIKKTAWTETEQWILFLVRRLLTIEPLNIRQQMVQNIKQPAWKNRQLDKEPLEFYDEEKDT